MFASHEGDVGKVVAANLIDALNHLKEAMVAVELGLAPQTRVRLGWRFGVEKRELFQIPHHVALRSEYLRRSECSQ